MASVQKIELPPQHEYELLLTEQEASRLLDLLGRMHVQEDVLTRVYDALACAGVALIIKWRVDV